MYLRLTMKKVTELLNRNPSVATILAAIAPTKTGFIACLRSARIIKGNIRTSDTAKTGRPGQRHKKK